MSLAVVTTLIDILGLLALGVWTLLLFMGFFLHALVFLFSSSSWLSELETCTIIELSWHTTNITTNTDAKSTPQRKSTTAQNKHTRTYTPDPNVSVLAAVPV